MRQIIFRGKLSHSETQWIEGNLIIARNGQPYIIPFEVFEPDGHHLIIDSDNPFWVNPETIGQFTNIIDIEGNKIFEGDILTFDYMDHVDIDISRYENTPCYTVKHNDYAFFGEGIKNSKLYAHPYRLKHCKKLGNIFDNAEMLSF